MSPTVEDPLEVYLPPGPAAMIMLDILRRATVARDIGPVFVQVSEGLFPGGLGQGQGGVPETRAVHCLVLGRGEIQIAAKSCYNQAGEHETHQRRVSFFL